MRKKLLGMLLGVTGFMLVACAPQDENVEVQDVTAQETEDAVIDTSEDEIYEGMDMLNPWVDSDEAGVLEATGFDLVPPSEATNIAYSYMPSTGMAQLNYNMGNAMWIYRIQPTEALEDISGIYCDWNYTGETKIAGMDAMEYNYASEQVGEYLDDIDYTRVINWYDAQKKLTYSLAVIGKELNGMDTTVYAENIYNLTTVE